MRSPYTVLREKYNFRYDKGLRGFWGFMDPSHIIMFERRTKMACKRFQDIDTLKTTTDAEYRVFSLKGFFNECIFDGMNFRLKEKYYGWSRDYLYFVLRFIKNAEVCVPKKEMFPLIIRNDYYTFYIAPQIYIYKVD